MELNITHMVTAADEMFYLSGSVMEHGDNAGAFTWQNSMDYALKHPLLDKNQIAPAKRYLKTFGAWSKEEIDAWSDQEVQALVIQLIAGDIREMERYSWEEYQKASERGTVGGHISRDGDQYWYYLGE